MCFKTLNYFTNIPDNSHRTKVTERIVQEYFDVMCQKFKFSYLQYVDESAF